MKFSEALQLVLIVLKLLGLISWSWFFVLLPTLISVALVIVIVILEIIIRALD